MAVNGLSQVHVSVGDVSRAVQFYRDVLGIELLFEVPEQSMAFFDLGNSLRLYVGAAESPDFSSAPLLYFDVADIDLEHARLKEAGVEFESSPHKVHETDGYELWMAFFRTPDRHMNAITENRRT